MSITGAFIVPHPPMIVPAVGKGSERQIAETAASYSTVAEEIAALAPDTIIISSPHSVMYSDYFHISPGKEAKGDLSRFGASSVKVSLEYDSEFVRELCHICGDDGFPAGTMGERERALDHGTMVPLYFITQRYADFRLVRIGLSGLPLTDHYRLGQYIKEVSDRLGRSTVYVASGDLSHKLQEYGPYGFAKEGPEYDERVMDVCARGAFEELLEFDEGFLDRAAECGHRSFVMMAGALDRTAVKPRFYSHQDVTGVGYGICSYYPQGEDESRSFLDAYKEKAAAQSSENREKCDEYVRLAWDTIESYVKARKVIKRPDGLPDEMIKRRAGAFVSIHKNGALRGCIGTISATKKCIADEIISNAISAATRDPRFDPIGEDELGELTINVDVLGDAEECSFDDLDVKRYGVIVTSGYKRGLLLPDLDGVDTPAEQVSIAMQKGGISPKEKYRLERFEVVRHF